MEQITYSSMNKASMVLTPMQSIIIFNTLKKEVINLYGEHRIKDIETAFNHDERAILRCFISLVG